MKLPRSGVQQDVLVKLPIPEDQSHELESDQTTSVPMSLHYRRFPTSDEYTSVDFSLKNGEWQAALPVQPVAGKLQYYLTIDGKDYLKDEPVVIRFRNDVPAGILIPHILLMFGAMLLAVSYRRHHVRGRFRLRTSRPACRFRSLVDGIPLWN